MGKLVWIEVAYWDDRPSVYLLELPEGMTVAQLCQQVTRAAEELSRELGGEAVTWADAIEDHHLLPEGVRLVCVEDQVYVGLDEVLAGSW